MVGIGLGRVIRFDPQALKRKEEIQRIRLEFDVRRRIRVWQEVEFKADEIVVELDFTFEKVKGFCKRCGLFMHDAIGCDRMVELERAAIKAPPTV
ncbi:hypothetical protein ACLB2K_024720 [Fragaria x ananassa]